MNAGTSPELTEGYGSDFFVRCTVLAKNEVGEISKHSNYFRVYTEAPPFYVSPIEPEGLRNAEPTETFKTGSTELKPK